MNTAVRFTVVVSACLLSVAVHAEAGGTQAIDIAAAVSPSGTASISLGVAQLDDATSDDALSSVTYRVEYRGKAVVDQSDLGLALAEHGRIGPGSRIEEITRRSFNESQQLPWGKSNTLVDHGNETHVWLRSDSGLRWEVVLRAYDDGVAFRYRIPQQDGIESVVIRGEQTAFRFSGNPTVHFLDCPDFLTDHEDEYHTTRLDALPARTLIDLPCLFDGDGGVAAAVTEARLRDFTSLYLWRDSADSSALGVKLSPRVDGSGDCVRRALPMDTPWRVVMLANRAGELIENDIVLRLNDPPAVDVSWFVPGKATWNWWNGTIEEPSLDFTPGMNFETHCHYIDFCARNGIAYHSVVSDDRPWYVQTQRTFSPGPETDILRARPELRLPEILDYARERGVGIRLWVHANALAPKLEEAFALYSSWGVKGLMVDFVNRDHHETVLFCEEVLKVAAKNRLHIQFHGIYKPTGLRRTYPNLVNHEGVLNLEYLKWSARCTPRHNVTVPYTRMLAGPMDYHLGGFRASTTATFIARDNAPYVLGTRCHHLAMYVVYENPMPMVCDFPTSYEGQPGFEFITEVPTTWDETRFLSGEPAEYIVLARRQGDIWYVGGMTDAPRQVRLQLDFLSSGSYEMASWSDATANADPNALVRSVTTVGPTDEATFSLATGGGFVLRLSPTTASGE